jgi:hypothetical protein
VTVVPVSESLKVDRPPSSDELALVSWLLEHGNTRGQNALSQIPALRVISQCQCGCASVDFSVEGQLPFPKSGMEVVSDYWWRTEGGNLCGVFVFLRDDLVAGIDLWSIDGQEIPSTLPPIDRLRSQDVAYDA